jgi:polyisoprenyl-teichoic acid--peptidoglycan teichoic acid transferase
LSSAVRGGAGAAADTPVPSRRSAGPRSARRARERRRRRRTRALAIAAAALTIGGLTAATTWLLAGGGVEPEPAAVDPEGAAPQEDQQTLLLIREPGDTATAEGATLLAAGPEGAPAVVLFVPVGTLLEVPGLGLDRVRQAHQYGGAVLAEAALENALGIEIDHTATVSESGLAAWLDRVGGLTLTVPDRLVRRDEDGTASVRFEPGEQFLDGPRLAELWAFRGREEDELATFPRQQLLWRELVAHLAEDEERLAGLVADGAPQLDTDADAAWLSGLFAELAAAQRDERLAFSLLPVEPFGGEGPDGSPTYRLREEETAALVQARLSDSVPEAGSGDPVRVQVLNGVGVPGVGQQVDRLLEGSRFRIVLTDNARSFDFTETQILIYDESEASLAAAERVQEQLGVGTIQVSRQPQSVVDLTIVVGADLLERSGSAPPDTT